jgi:class 3 adenylate cyclase/predicted ATPase
MDIAGWLRKLGLEHHELAFHENKIDGDILPSLTADDLKDLGVALVGERRRLLEAIAALRAQAETADLTAKARDEPRTTGSAAEIAAVSPVPERPAAADRGVGERRHLTVMFCDIVSSTEIAARLDAEEWRDIVTDYHRAVTEAVARFGGHVAKNLGDGALVYFGYPKAQENDAERAVRAGLAIVEAVAAQGRALTTHTAVEFAVRVGIHVGAVVLSEDGELYGDLPNIAGRVQAAAAPGTVVITRDVHQLVSGLFVISDRGIQTLKGVSGPVGLFQVVRASGSGRRRSASRITTALVGREEELRQIESRWARVRTGQGQLVLLVGEAGLGKSRLIDEFQSRLTGVPHTWLELACSQLLQNTPFHPFIESVRHRLEEQEPTREGRLAALANWHQAVGLDPAQSVPLVAPLLELPVPEEYPPPPAAPEARRRMLIATLAGWVKGGAETQAIVLHVEDAHWADPSTLELLRVLAEQGGAVSLLVLVTSRPEFSMPWPHRAHHTAIALGPLERRDIQRMVNQVAALHALSPQTVEALVTRTGGVPLFIEEVTRSLFEGDEQSGQQAIPASLQALLTTRLDRLGAAKEVAQLAAVLGGGFGYALIRAVTGLSDINLIENLERLAEADLIHVRGIPPESDYRFKHALMRDAAYETLLKSRRRELHRVVARTLRAEFMDVAKAQPELLAYHLTETGDFREAIGYWQQAGQQAVGRSADQEAITHFSSALKLVQQLAEGLDRDQLELDLRVALGVPLISTRGYSAPEVERTYARARELSEKVGGSPQLANVLWGRWVGYLTGGPIGAALEMAEQYRAIAETTQDSGHLLETCQVMGIAHFYLGEFRLALPHLARGSSLYEPERHHALVYEHGGADTGVAIRTHEALALWTLGYPDQARKKMDHALETAESLSRHPFTVAFAHYFDAWLHKLCRDEELAERATNVAIAICDDLGFPFWKLASATLRGSILTERGAEAEGVEIMRQELASYEGIGGQLYGPELSGLLSMGLARTGRFDEALQSIADALRKVAHSQDRWWHAELHRISGELLPGDQSDAAEDAFQEALSVARAQAAKSWELRAAMSLSRLWQRSGKVREAEALLGNVLASFDEGFGTADLREAATLLAKLKGQAPIRRVRRSVSSRDQSTSEGKN